MLRVHIGLLTHRLSRRIFRKEPLFDLRSYKNVRLNVPDGGFVSVGLAERYTLRAKARDPAKRDLIISLMHVAATKAEAIGIPNEVSRRMNDEEGPTVQTNLSAPKGTPRYLKVAFIIGVGLPIVMAFYEFVSGG
ncbi:hypothetical protein FGG78_04800 [Thioclava sp. BHET1]|nr:hypothetical protein FGG78_04800 [Thioclava sp. BHET1]